MTCESEGEIYVDESEVVEFYVDDDPILQLMLVSCTKDYDLNPYTTVLKHMIKGA